MRKKDKLDSQDRAEATVREIVARMAPLEVRLSVHPTARPVPLRLVSGAVVRDHLGRYTYVEPR